MVAEVHYKASALPELIPSHPNRTTQRPHDTQAPPEVTTGGCNMELTYTVDTKSYKTVKSWAISAADWRYKCTRL